jgi:hypothetical protein
MLKFDNLLASSVYCHVRWVLLNGSLSGQVMQMLELPVVLGVFFHILKLPLLHLFLYVFMSYKLLLCSVIVLKWFSPFVDPPIMCVPSCRGVLYCLLENIGCTWPLFHTIEWNIGLCGNSCLKLVWLEAWLHMLDLKGLSNLIPRAERYIGKGDQSSCLMEEASRNFIFLQLQALRKRKRVSLRYLVCTWCFMQFWILLDILVEYGKEVIPRHCKLSKVVAVFH